ncbi:MAG: hypothetical protein HRT38_01530 [Alteromonadaceae bacterium]|nr:hypothetical protein [Alteromonadaceae bacterium]
MDVNQLKRFNDLLDKLLNNTINRSELSEYQKLCHYLLHGLDALTV